MIAMTAMLSTAAAVTFAALWLRAERARKAERSAMLRSWESDIQIVIGDVRTLNLMLEAVS